MKSLKFAWIVVVVGLWHCGDDGEKGTSPVATVDPPPAPRGLSVERIGDGEVWFQLASRRGHRRGALRCLSLSGGRRGRGY